MRKLIMILFVCLTYSTAFSQNITNTLAANGIFIIKDASNIYFTLSQSTGQVNILKTLRLENTTTSTTGVIFKGTTRFLHDYFPGLSRNCFLGGDAGNFTLTANYNTGIGHTSLSSLTSGDNNTAIGYLSLNKNTSGFTNTALGLSSMKENTIGSENTAVGSGSLLANQDGNYNTAVGHGALTENVSGEKNTGIGLGSLNSTQGNNNTGVGFNSLRSNVSGNNNSAFGYESMWTNQGNNNSSFGYFSGYNINTGSNLTCLGYNAQPTTSSATNQITLGDANVTSLRCNTTTITSLSDARDKKNIRNLELGINFIMKLQPRLYNWDKREWYSDNVSDGSKMKELPAAGFIAQELDEVQTSENAEWLNLVLKDNPEKLEATPGNLLPIVVKAIQDLKAENEELKDRLLKYEQLQNILALEIEKLKTGNPEMTQVKLSGK